MNGNNDSFFLSKPSEIDVRYAFRYILGREPESERVIHEKIEEATTNSNLIEILRNSYEFLFKDIFNTLKKFNGRLLDYGCETSQYSDDITLIQTCDGHNYLDILTLTSRFNMYWAMTKCVSYNTYIGIKRGDLPHYATLNRIFMLEEMVDRGYAGWAIYLDADAIVIDRDLNIKSFLEEARKNSKHFIFHNVTGNDDCTNINVACFCVDLGHSIVKSTIKLWANIYRYYFNLNHYNNQTWNVLLHDQNTLTMILKSNPSICKYVMLYPLESSFSQQCGRFNDLSIPSDSENNHRMERLAHYAYQYYPELRV